MADKNIPNERPQGKNEAYVHSLPWSLRHCSPLCAIEDARDIAAFLKEVLTTPRADGIQVGDTFVGDWNAGLNLCFYLLIDKLDIASGTYKFPELTHASNALHLCERKEGRHD